MILVPIGIRAHAKNWLCLKLELLLICDGHIRLGLSAVDEAKHHLDRVTSLLVSPVVEPFGREGGFCCLVDPREHGSSTEWWLPLSERWAELKSCDHAVTVYEPRMIELRPLSGVVRHIWEADRHASDVCELPS
jgi:hypothetical protein